MVNLNSARVWASDRSGKKLKIMRKFLAIIIMRKHALIMQKLHQIMRFQI